LPKNGQKWLFFPNFFCKRQQITSNGDITQQCKQISKNATPKKFLRKFFLHHVTFLRFWPKNSGNVQKSLPTMLCYAMLCYTMLFTLSNVFNTL
jgi:hypothetical protein